MDEAQIQRAHIAWLRFLALMVHQAPAEGDAAYDRRPRVASRPFAHGGIALALVLAGLLAAQDPMDAGLPPADAETVGWQVLAALLRREDSPFLAVARRYEARAVAEFRRRSPGV